jgi:alpha-tubulin suppressor-like RCC1 family protein
MPAPFGLPAELAELQDDYELVGELGRGGAAVVYRARDRALGRDVAIKVVHPRPAAPDDDPVARLGREARTVAQLQHPNIVAVHAVRRLRGGGLALVMQCVPGATLKRVVQQDGPMAPERCERVLRDVAAALAYAHARGVVHRDVKPENVFLDEDTGRALLADFGIARSAGADSLTMTGTALGTPFYMSPEQVDGGALDGRSDLYSLGLVAWELLTGRRPWDGESLYQVIYKQKHEELPPIEALRPGVPPRLQYIVERMLQKRPGARWAGAEGLLAQLDHSVLPADYARWQRALPARVARYTERPRPEAAPTAGQEAAPVHAAASTLHFARPPHGTPDTTSATPARPAAERLADTQRVSPAVLAATAPVPAAAAAEAAELPRPGATLDLRTLAPAAPLADHAAPAYADLAEPTWSAGDDPGAVPVAAPRRGRTAYVRYGLTAAAVTTVAVSTLGFWHGRSGEAATVPAAPAGPAAGVPLPPEVRTARVRPPAALAGAPGTLLLAAGGQHSCAATTAGTLHCWGANARGQIGDGRTGARTAPRAVTGTLRFVGVSAGLFHTCGLTRLGELYCWGADDRGQLGDATTVPRNAPVRVAGDGQYSAVSAGATHTCGITTLGALRCWGANDQGQLGDGGRASRTTPHAVALGTAGVSVGVVAVAAGGQHTCAVTDDGRMLCWGAGREGQLGDGARTAFRALPAPVALTSPASAVSAGLAHSCALTADGSAWCWGRNESGQLGDGTRTGRPTPVRVLADSATRFTQLVAGAAHTCALDAGGAVWCWGRNGRGAVGTGPATSQPTPTRVSLPAAALAVAAGTAHSCATLVTERTVCWGDNAGGQLGHSLRLSRPRVTAAGYPAVGYPAGVRAATPE